MIDYMISCNRINISMKNLLFLISLFSSTLCYTQPLKVVFGAGAANYSGDIQQQPFTLNQAHTVFSIGATYELSNHFLMRSDFSFASIGADDKFSKSSGNQIRNLNFKSNILEFTLMAEYNILDLFENGWTPYLFTGVGLYAFNPYSYDSAGQKTLLAPLRTEGQGLPGFPDRKPYKTLQLNIPAGVGIKYALSDDIHLGAEFGIRKLFTDYIDDVSTTYVDKDVLFNAYGPKTVAMSFRGDELLHNPYNYPPQGAQRGSPKYKDYYYFAQVRLSIRLNWFEESGGSVKRFGCPGRF